MKQNAYIAGVGITRFGKHLDRSLSSLAHEAIEAALKDAAIDRSAIEAAWAGTAAAPVITGQVCIAGQAILRGVGIGRIPVVNVENACATSSTALQQGATMITLGAYDVVLAFGVEKLYHPDKQRIFSVFEGCRDLDDPASLDAYLLSDGASSAGAGQTRSIFMDIYARLARAYMARTGATARDFAAISAKNSFHGSLNPNAQFRDVLSIDQVLAAAPIIDPLTLLMCSPIGDGAAAAIIMSERAIRKFGIRKPVRIDSALLASGYDRVEGETDLTTVSAAQAYAEAGIDPRDINCVELHDASSPAELMYYEKLGLCAPEDALALLHDGATSLGGRVPVNPSGGLVRKGHPIGATGLGQIHELTVQLRGEAGARQVEGARVAVAENGGGFLGEDSAALTMTVLSR
ncbi:MAG: thiolase family protein [Alphaproteobacteria bacterium]|nr:thiolase family protein [Alphaproteobacteria bacterium]